MKMHKIVIPTIISLVVVMMGSCGNGTKKVPFDDGDSAEVENLDPTLYGICGEATSMNSLQLITDTGDTLRIDMSAAQEDEKVFGGLQPGDRMAVVPTKDKKEAVMVVNQSSLLGSWVMPNPIDGSDEIGICIKEGGIVEGIEQSTITYKTWRLVRGQLEIVCVREGGSEEDEVNLYDIVKLGADSLVFKDSEDIFEYGRQKPRETYGLEVELEDATDDFKM
ncbi:MAG: hypothetical protein ILA25_00855 [Prevotella sp.]|nr:hypothetical protein [Prevotella sp.]